MLKINWWLLKKKTTLYVGSKQFNSKMLAIRATTIAIIIGLVLGVIVMFLNGKNGFLFVQIMLEQAFSTTSSSANDTNIAKTINYFVVYSFMGIGLALGFKVGLFNMGGSGQALLGFGLSILMLTQITGVNDDKTISLSSISAGTIIGIFVIFIVAGTFISVLSGILKIFLNIHEVATSILLNWSIWFVIKWFLSSHLIPNDNLGTPTIPTGIFSIGGQSWVLGVILLLGAVICLTFVLKYTTFGFKANVVGKQITAAKYAGINDKFYIVMITALQGLFISIGAMFYYMVIVKSQSFSSDSMPTIGFDAIAVALVASNNIFAILPVAFIWGVFKVGSEIAVASPDMLPTSKYIADLIFSLIIYSSTIAVVLMKFTPLHWFKVKLYLLKHKQVVIELKPLKQQLFEDKNHFKANSAYQSLTNQLVKSKKELSRLKKELKNKLQTLGAKEAGIFQQTEQYHKQVKVLNDLKQAIKLKHLEIKEWRRDHKIKLHKHQKMVREQIQTTINRAYLAYRQAKHNKVIVNAQKTYRLAMIAKLNKVIILKNEILLNKHLINRTKLAKRYLNKHHSYPSKFKDGDNFHKLDLEYLTLQKRNIDSFLALFVATKLKQKKWKTYCDALVQFCDNVVGDANLKINNTYQQSFDLINDDSIAQKQTRQIVKQNRSTYKFLMNKKKDSKAGGEKHG